MKTKTLKQTIKRSLIYIWIATACIAFINKLPIMIVVGIIGSIIAVIIDVQADKKKRRTQTDKLELNNK